MLKFFAVLIIMQPQIFVLQRQFLLFGKVLGCPRDHMMHQTALILGTMQPATNRLIRRVGKPRHEWIGENRNRASEVLDGHHQVARLVYDPSGVVRSADPCLCTRGLSYDPPDRPTPCLALVESVEILGRETFCFSVSSCGIRTDRFVSAFRRCVSLLPALLRSSEAARRWKWFAQQKPRHSD